MPSFKRINSCGNGETDAKSEHDVSNPAPSLALAAANEINKLGAFQIGANPVMEPINYKINGGAFKMIFE
eukprot:scaffold33694_cov98-Cyclotella_meneghiniana.AAC.8